LAHTDNKKNHRKFFKGFGMHISIRSYNYYNFLSAIKENDLVLWKKKILADNKEAVMYETLLAIILKSHPQSANLMLLIDTGILFKTLFARFTSCSSSYIEYKFPSEEKFIDFVKDVCHMYNSHHLYYLNYSGSNCPLCEHLRTLGYTN